MINTGEQEAYILVDRFIETGMPFAMYRIDKLLTLSSA